MRVLSILIVLAGASCVIAFAPHPASAATSPAMKACSQQWSDMKKANKVPEGEKWSDFWSQCSKDFAAKNGGDTATEQKATTETPAKTKKKTAAVSEDDSPSSAQQKKDCDAKWSANKAKTGAHGWHDYFQFMSQCM
jgi:hypothetical protein